MNSEHPHNWQRKSSDGAVSAPSWHAVLLPWILILLSWGLLGIAFFTQWNVLLDHDYLLRTSHWSWIVALLVFLVSWQIMTAAMMLPSSLSRLMHLYESHQQRTQVFFIIGYTLAWTGFALLAFLGDTLLHEMVRQWRWLYLHSQLIGALTLACAGIYQLSPLKRHCLQCCNVLTSTATQDASSSMWQQGLRYGIWCVGSSWALMLIMFGIGMKNPFMMALLAVVMFLEREILPGKEFRLMLGSICLLLALLWYFYPLIT